MRYQLKTNFTQCFIYRITVIIRKQLLLIIKMWDNLQNKQFPHTPTVWRSPKIRPVCFIVEVPFVSVYTAMGIRSPGGHFQTFFILKILKITFTNY